MKEKDAFLFRPPRVCEPAIAHKLAEYLQPLFPKYDVDIEYDKYGPDCRKELENFKSVCTDNSTDRVRPDIVVHHRGIRIGNAVVLEIKDYKASKTARLCVEEKLRRFTDRTGPFGYSIGVLWLFGDRKLIEDAKEFIFYVNGECYDDIDSVTKKLREYEVECSQRFNRVKKLVNELKEHYNAAVTKFEDEQKSQTMEGQEFAPSEENLVEAEVSDRFDSLKTNFIEKTYWRTLHEKGIETEADKTVDFWEDNFDEKFSNLKDDIRSQVIEENERELQEAMSHDLAQDEQDKHDYDEVILRDYIEGRLYDKDFCYTSLGQNDSEARKKWLGAWEDLHFLSVNSLLSDHLRCVKMQKRLLEIAFEIGEEFEYRGVLRIFSSDEERATAEEHLAFLTMWLQDRTESFRK